MTLSVPLQPAAMVAAAPVSQEHVPCPKCGLDDSSGVVTGADYLYHLPGEFQVVECRRCGLWFQNPRPVLSELSRLYPPDYGPHGVIVSAGSAARAAAKPAAATRAYRALRHWLSSRPSKTELIPEFVAGGRSLEIGCATGQRLRQLQMLGWRDLHGIELVRAAADRARAEGFSIRCGPVETELQTYPDVFFDVVVASMVLEHLANPFRVVRDIARKLKPGGQFLFSTIVRDSLDARMYGGYWSGFDFPRHLVYFRKQDIADMLAESFERVEAAHQNAPIDFLRSASWRQCRGLDTVVARLAKSRAANPLGAVLAWCGLTCRVTYRCRRQFPSHPTRSP